MKDVKVHAKDILRMIARADGYVATRLMCRLICNLPELSIRIFNPLTSYL